MSDWKLFDIEAVIRRAQLRESLGGYRVINGAVPWQARFALYRHNYRVKAGMVKAGEGSWAFGDPYQIADWVSVFTPIEAAVWSDLRCAGLSMWPQFPVGRFFVDFGNPVARIAIECDGKAFHDAQKDAARDLELARLGWKVLRIPGWRCKNEAPELDPDMTEDELEARREFINERTPAFEIAYAAQLLADAA